MTKTTPDNLDKAIAAELDRFAGMLKADIAEAQKAAAKVAVKELKAKAPGKKKKYARAWKSKTTVTRTGAETVIYQGDRPGLAHLLEFGHPIVSGGRTVGQARAFPHVEPAEQTAINEYEKELTKGIENGT